MAWFQSKSAQVIRRGVGDKAVEERTTRRVGREVVEVRRVRATPEKKKKRDAKSKGREGKPRPPGRDGRSRSTRHFDDEIILPPETGKKQMLVRELPTQTQIVILEGPSLVEHYVARQERTSLAHNMYLAKVKNVLPGMEAAFLDFGQPKNGVLYAGDLKVDPEKHGHHPRIEQVISVGDEVLVQVVKDAMGAKGARLTGQVTVPGRYLVLAPESDMQGISRRLPEDDRIRLRDILRDVKPDNYGVIVRTAAAAASKGEIEADINRLVRLWSANKEEAAVGGAPRPVYEEPGLLIRVIREHFTSDFKRLLIDDGEAMDSVVSYLEKTAPDLVDKVSLYRDEIPLFERYHVEDQLQKALDRKVWLKSGGHLVVDRTEALTVIDVNTGKFVGSSNLEDTVLQNNLEAAEEIGRQLRLRDIGGIIVIDFIDMEISRNRQAVLRRLKETLAKDKVRTQVFDVSNLGLVEMTRKNVSAGLLEQFSELCPNCSGRGVVLHEGTALRGLPIETDDDVEAM